MTTSDQRRELPRRTISSMTLFEQDRFRACRYGKIEHSLLPGESFQGWAYSTCLVQRRGRDSNPRYRFTPYTGLANRRIRPLCHLSQCDGVTDSNNHRPVRKPASNLDFNSPQAAYVPLNPISH